MTWQKNKHSDALWYRPETNKIIPEIVKKQSQPFNPNQDEEYSIWILNTKQWMNLTESNSQTVSNVTEADTSYLYQT
jgi:hypothetical protein